MRLSKEEFVTHVSNLLKMSNEIDSIVNALGTTETIFDEWQDHYYRLVDKLCEFSDRDYENLDGTALDYWLYRAEGAPCIFPYYIKDNTEVKEVHFNSIEDVYDFIVYSQE